LWDTSLNRSRTVKPLGFSNQGQIFKTTFVPTSNSVGSTDDADPLNLTYATCILNGYITGANPTTCSSSGGGLGISHGYSISTSVTEVKVNWYFVKGTDIYHDKYEHDFPYSSKNVVLPINFGIVEGNLDSFRQNARLKIQFYGPNGVQTLTPGYGWAPAPDYWKTVNFSNGLPLSRTEFARFLGMNVFGKFKVRVLAFMSGNLVAKTDFITFDLEDEHCNDFKTNQKYYCHDRPQTNPNAPSAPPTPAPIPTLPIPDPGTGPLPYTGVFPEEDQILSYRVATATLFKNGMSTTTDWTSPDDPSLYQNAIAGSIDITCKVYSTKRVRNDTRRRMIRDTLRIIYDFECSSPGTGTVTLKKTWSFDPPISEPGFGSSFQIVVKLPVNAPGDYVYNADLKFVSLAGVSFQITPGTGECVRITTLNRYRECKPKGLSSADPTVTNYIANTETFVQNGTLPSYQYERRVAGPVIVRAKIKYPNPNTDPKYTIDIDGYRGSTMIEAKWADSDDSATFDNTTKSPFIIEAVRKKWINELIRYELVMQEWGDITSRNPIQANPFSSLIIKVGDSRMVNFARNLLNDLAIEADVQYEP
jgi:hypothetical protein